MKTDKIPRKIREFLLAIAPKCCWCNLRIKVKIELRHDATTKAGERLAFHKECWDSMPENARQHFLESKQSRRSKP